MNAGLSGLPSNRLLARVHELVRRGNAVEAELLAHMGEVDARKLYLEEGCSSMFGYCQRVLHFPEAVAYKRIQAARAGRRHPGLLEAVQRGELHVTGASLLAPRLSGENAEELIRAATHRSADEIRRLLADREPKPDVPATVRRLPERAAAAPVVGTAAPARPAPEARPAQPRPQPRTEPLGGERYAIHFTADRELHGQIQELRALMRHTVPDGDVGKILAIAVGLLLGQVRARKFGECTSERPRAAKLASPGSRPPTRKIPAAIRRAVARRDGERCTYVSASGRRCEERNFLEFDHREPWARDRRHSVDGIRLRCRAHNQLAARNEFGERHMARFRRAEAPSSSELDSNPVGPGSGSG